MKKGQIYYNKLYGVWHISTLGHSFSTKNNAIIFKKLILEKQKLEKRLDKIKLRAQKLTI